MKSFVFSELLTQSTAKDKIQRFLQIHKTKGLDVQFPLSTTCGSNSAVHSGIPCSRGRFSGPLSWRNGPPTPSIPFQRLSLTVTQRLCPNCFTTVVHFVVQAPHLVWMFLRIPYFKKWGILATRKIWQLNHWHPFVKMADGVLERGVHYGLWPEQSSITKHCSGSGQGGGSSQSHPSRYHHCFCPSFYFYNILQFIHSFRMNEYITKNMLD